MVPSQSRAYQSWVSVSVHSSMVLLSQPLTPGSLLQEEWTLKIKCQVCGTEGYLQHIGKSYYRVRHYAGFKNGKPVFKYHRQEPEYIQAILGQSNDGRVDQIDQKRVDQNLYATGSFNQTEPWAGSLVRTGRKPPKLVVVGSNPTPPVYNKPHTLTDSL
jgi:hypothetical protein